MTRKLHSIKLQSRDLELFRGLFESRIMLLRHIVSIHFDDHAEAAKKRVQRLKAAGYIHERPRTANEPAIHFLTRKAFDALGQNGMLVDYAKIGWAAQEKRMKVSPLALRHELGVMDCKAAMFAAVRTQQEFSLVEFITWPERTQFIAVHPGSRAKVIIKPDGFIRLNAIHSGIEPHFYFLEVDYSTEPLETLALKIRCYHNHYRDGGFAKHLGHYAAEYRKYPFQVLVVCRSVERRDNIAEILRSSTPPIRSFGCIATIQEFTSSPLVSVGLQPSAPSIDQSHASRAFGD